MTLIVTTISKNGIIHASDRATMVGSEGRRQRGPDAVKTFRISDFGLVSIAGSEEVGHRSFDEWFPSFLGRGAYTQANLRELASDMRNELEAAQPAGTPRGQIIHLSGYTNENGPRVPLFFHIRNRDSDENGDYVDPTREYRCDENFQSRDYRRGKFRKKWETRSSASQLYVNGSFEGRIAFLKNIRTLSRSLKTIWTRGHLLPPKSLEEEQRILGNQLDLLITLCEISNFQNIGGQIDIMSVPSVA